LTEYSQTDRFSRGSIVESNHWAVLHRPVELARITGQVRSHTHFSGDAVYRYESSKVLKNVLRDYQPN
jgi:hypothetical protein